jgi:FixJ family two-component response regulator
MSAQPCTFIIEDDDAVRDSLGMIIETVGYAQQSFDNIEHFFTAYDPGTPGCLILDANESGITNLELRTELNHRNISLPIIFLTRYGDLPMDLTAANYGRSAVLTKPVQIDVLIKTIQTLLQPEANTTSQGGIDVP